MSKVKTITIAEAAIDGSLAVGNAVMDEGEWVRYTVIKVTSDNGVVIENRWGEKRKLPPDMIFTQMFVNRADK